MAAIGLKFGGWVAGTKWPRTIPHIGVRLIGVRGGGRGSGTCNTYPSLSKTLAANALTIDSNCDSQFGSITKAFAVSVLESDPRE